MRDKIIAAVVGAVLVILAGLVGVGGFLGYQAIERLDANAQTTASNVKELDETIQDQSDSQSSRIDDSLSGVDLGSRSMAFPRR
ncbi:hypothetical protein CS006_08835 [Bifidobacterium primatium]|uniref:Uncharacterized protein n=1 Tax=Bifidobacterium primatium TaxID=2045438 RepID=A0A2M9H774_9BIFI|nr:hypothetical protein [Bifidobacterium primatium]PJM72659.1 hypothetical protein CS006_08835 [Bifidobacterium primatium]